MSNTKQTMSITRALAELKRLDDRIQRNQSSTLFVGISIGKGEAAKVHGVAGKTVEALSKDIQSSIDSILDLYKNRTVLKSAIVLSNALTKLTVNGVEMSVAEAIELKSSIALKQSLVSSAKNQWNQANASVQSLNNNLEKQIEQFMTTMYGSDKGTKVDEAQTLLVSKTQKDQKEAGLINPYDLIKLIAKWEEEISVVATELDFMLSESNAKTTIEV